MWSFFSRDPTKDFPYEIGDPIPTNSERVFWKLHKGKKKGSGEEVTIFILDIKNCSFAEVEAAKAGVKRLKTLRHPNVLTFLDSVESEKAIYLATEYVEPLEQHLETKSNLQGQSWGLFQVTRAISFLVNDGNLKHNNVQLGSVFVNTAGEWKLGGLEYVSGSEASYVSKVPPGLNKLDPPEVKSGASGGTKWTTDAWGLGILIWEVFNGTLQNHDGPLQSLKNPGKMPKSLVTTFNELISGNIATRPNPADVIARGRRPGGFFKNDLVDSLLFLEEIQIKEQNEKTRFFNGLSSALDKFPDDICRYKILPQLINAFEFGNAGSSVLTPMFKLGKLLEEAEYQTKIVPCVVKLFASTDRATRVRLLQQLEHIADHLLPITVNDKIFPNIITGFMDTNPTVREQTVKAMLYLAPKLNSNNLNVELLKHFARLQIKDDQGGIRTNTTICLGKISCYLNPQTRRKVLIPAFTRVFQDNFPQARVAGILALAATQQYYLLSEIATRVLPSLCCLTTDPDKSVRENAFRTVKGFIGKLERVSDDPSLKEKYEAEIDTSTPTVADAASSWAGWAVSALTSKFNRSQSTQSALGQIGQGSSGGSGRTKGKYPFAGQSSSSTSTTTSSIPSTPSADRDVLQPTAEGQESATDYENDDWDNEDWGSIDEAEDTTGKPASNFDTSPAKREQGVGVVSNNSRPSWDTWAIKETEEKDGWEDDGFVPAVQPQAKVSSITNWAHSDTNNSVENHDEFFSSLGTSSSKKNNSLSSDWDTQDWNDETSVVTSTESSSRNEEMRKRREERKLHRQKELETKRTVKGPMKLGSRKT